jgi:Domain of unknown function (DUF4397)
MTVPRRTIRLLLAAAVVISAGMAAAMPAMAAPATGWVRLAHLSPNAPAVDVYLYNFGNPDARLVLHHVSYGTVSSYEQVPDGDYTVSMRAAGAPASVQPVLSTGFQVSGNQAYTVAGMGPAAALRLQVLKDTFTAPAGGVLVRVIQASLRQHVVSMSLGGLMLARKLDFASMTSYAKVTAGNETVRVNGSEEDVTARLSLAADSIHTLVVLDGTDGLRVNDLTDAAGSQVLPRGGAATGLGGTAPRPAPSPLPWLAALAAGFLLAGAGAFRFRQLRSAATRTP